MYPAIFIAWKSVENYLLTCPCIMEVLDQNNQNNQVQFFMFAFQRLRSDGGSVFSVFFFFTSNVISFFCLSNGSCIKKTFS